MASLDDQTGERFLDGMRKVLAEAPDVAYALLFDWARVYRMVTSSDLDDLEAYCAALAAKAR